MNNNVIINPISVGSEAFDTYIDVADAPNVAEIKSSGNFIGANTIEVELYEIHSEIYSKIFKCQLINRNYKSSFQLCE